MKFHTRFDLPKGPKVICTAAEGRTKPEFEAECDMNRIMERYKRTGQLPESALRAAARYGDFSQVPDFMEMQEKLIAANELFAALPAAVRKQFDNDPGQFVAASETEEGRALMVKLGLGKEGSQPPRQPLKKWKGALPPEDAIARLKGVYDFDVEAPEGSSSSKAKGAVAAPKVSKTEEAGQASE